MRRMEPKQQDFAWMNQDLLTLLQPGCKLLKMNMSCFSLHTAPIAILISQKHGMSLCR